MVQMAFCDFSHTFHKQLTNVSQHVFVILLVGILVSPLSLKSFAVSRWVQQKNFEFPLSRNFFNDGVIAIPCGQMVACRLAVSRNGKRIILSAYP